MSLWGKTSEGNSSEALSVKILFKGEHKKTILLEDGTTFIGRMAENHIVIDDPKVSRSHASIIFQNGVYMLEDQDSENGTYLNEKPIKKQALKEGDVIRLGAYQLTLVKTTQTEQVIREENLSLSEQEWRMDQTITMTDPSMQKKYLESLKTPPKTPSPNKKFPTLDLTLNIAGKTITKSVTFEKGTLRENTEETFIKVQIGYGKYILSSKIPL